MPSSNKQCNTIGTSSSCLHKTDSKNKIRNRRRNRKKHKQSLLNKFTKVPQQKQQLRHQKPVFRAADMKQPTARCCTKTTNNWNKIYNNAINWQYQYQTDFWKNVAKRRQLENYELRHRVDMLQASLGCSEAVDPSNDLADDNGSVTSSSDEESEARESFLTFMEISTRHQIQKQLDQQEFDRCYE